MRKQENSKPEMNQIWWNFKVKRHQKGNKYIRKMMFEVWVIYRGVKIIK